MGGRQGRARELQARDRAKREGLQPNTPNSVERFQRQFLRNLSELPKLQNLDREKALRFANSQQVEEICDVYWRDWAYQNSPMLVDAKPLAKRSHTLLIQLIELVRNGDAFANDAILLLWPEVELNTTQRINALEIWAEACSQIIETKSNSGRRKINYLNNTVDWLVQCWIDISGKKFSKNFSPTSGKQESFEADSCQFVLTLAHSIDQSVTLREVQTALRKKFR